MALGPMALPRLQSATLLMARIGKGASIPCRLRPQVDGEKRYFVNAFSSDPITIFPNKCR
jgi:hypothetical protein